jgi:hypothetical protein
LVVPALEGRESERSRREDEDNKESVELYQAALMSGVHMDRLRHVTMRRELDRAPVERFIRFTQLTTDNGEHSTSQVHMR